MACSINKFLAISGILTASAIGADGFGWGNVNIGGGGFVSAVLPSPIEQNVIYTRTDVGGAYRWAETSKSWISLMDWVNVDERGLLGVEAMAVDPTTPGKVYMMTGTVYWNQASDGIGRSAFLRSTDYGSTWDVIYTWDNNTKWFNVHGNGMGRGNGERLAVDPANSDILFYGTRNKGLWKSTNNGTSWAKVASFPVDTTWNGGGISFVAFDPSTKGASSTSRIYVGLLREGNNVYVSSNGGSTWSPVAGRPVEQYAPRLMPQRIAITPDGSNLFITFGDGAGPHTQQWAESWGTINDWFNRGAVYKVTTATNTWTDVSPQNLIDPPNDGTFTDPATYYGCYSGISIDPNNPLRIVVSSIASYRGPQFWKIGNTWKDSWGDNIFVSTDGGATWAANFKYYWIDGGQAPSAEQMNPNGYPWIVGNTIHWIGSVAIDPYNPDRVFVTSGNGVFMTENILNFSYGEPDWSGVAPLTQNTVWKFASAGIEEVVPLDLVSIPGGPVISVIGDYDGFIHQDIRIPAPLGRHKTSVAGESVSLGTSTGLSYAPKTGKLAKVAKIRSVALKYNSVPIGPVQFSADTGKTWTVETYTTNPPDTLNGGKVALSANGSVTLWMPQQGSTMYRHSNAAWTPVAGINFWGTPFSDPSEDNTFYVFNRFDGGMYVSIDGGVSFAKRGIAGVSNFGIARAMPGRTGDLWVPIANMDSNGVRSGKLMRSTNGGTSFTQIAGVGYCEAVGFGKNAPTSTVPAIYVYATIQGQTGVFQSIDEGATWTRVNDEGHEYGGLANGEFVIGDMNTFGVVYMSTAGRGIAARMPADWVENPVNLKMFNISKQHNTQAFATMRGSLLTLNPAQKPLRLTVHNLQGRIISEQFYSSLSQVDLLTLTPHAGIHVVTVHEGQRLLLSHKLAVR